MTEENANNNNNNIRTNKNVSILGFAFMLQFTAFNSAANLQSSVNTDKSMGTIALAAINIPLIISSFLPVVIIKWLGCKWTIVWSLITFMPYLATQFFPRLYTLVPAAIILGLGGGSLWCATSTYITVITEAFGVNLNNGLQQESLIVRSFGLFFVISHLAPIWGNLISSYVLSSGIDVVSNNVTIVVIKNVGEICGAKFCPGISTEVNPNLKPPETEKIHILSGIFLSFICCAVLIVIFFLDPLTRYKKSSDPDELSSGFFNAILVTIKQLFKKYQLLLLPITLFIGAEQAFVTADFTRSFISCGWGIANIGYTMLCFGISNDIAGGIAIGLTKFFGRFPILMVTQTIYGLLLIWMKYWIVIENDYWTFCSMAAIYGLVCGTLLIQINAFYGVLFSESKEVAFCCMELLKSIGSVLTYIISPLLCTGTKLTILFILLIVGTFGYSMVEYLRYKEQQNNTLDLSRAAYNNKGCDAF